MDVGPDLGRGVRQLCPVARDGLQEVEILWRVDGRGWRGAVGFRRLYVVAGGLGPCQEPRGTLGLLGAALLDAADDEGLRVVLGVLGGVDGFHGIPIALASRRAAISASLKPTSCMISTVCSPTPGALRRISTAASESLIGLAADFTGPMPG